MQAHYANEHSERVLYPYGVFCDNKLVPSRTDGVATFNFSDPNSVVYNHPTYGDVYGGGRSTFTGEGVLFYGEANHGFTEGACEIKHVSEGCGDDVCVLKISDPNQGSVADCNDNTKPYQNLFQYKICCTPTEYCRDGIDNTGDGLVDCASPDCHPSSLNNDVPQQCDPGSYIPGNNQTTADCVIGGTPEAPIFSPHCMYSDPNDPFGTEVPFYCNYGYDDDPLTHSDGFCCPEGQYYNSESGDCEDFQVCGIQPGDYCGFSFPLNTNSWLGQLFDGGDKWCHSHLPNLRTIGGVTRSEACCPVMTHGTFGYFIVDENIKIFGAE